MLAVATFAVSPALAQERKPNVVFILADNVGYGDLGPYGGGELRGAPTPRIDQMAREGLRLTQFLVEPACTPSRAALMTGQYSIRSGLSLIAIEGTPYTLPARAFTMGELFKGAGYATAIFGKWHLGSAPQSLPTAHGFDEFYGIPPDISWDAATYVDTIELTQSMQAPPGVLLARGPQIVEATLGGPLRTVKPFTQEVRANIDNEFVDKAIDFMRRQKAAGKPFFLYLPFSMGHAPNLPAAQFKGKSRIGNYGDKMMEGDYHIGQILDTLKELGVDDSTLVVFASDNGPCGRGRAGIRQSGHARYGQCRPLSRRAGRSDRGFDTDGSDYPLARAGQAQHHLVRHVLDHGFLADLCPHRRRYDADGPADRRRRPDRRFARQERDGASRKPLELHRRRPGRRALEAVAHLLHRHPPDRQWAAAAAWHFLGQRFDGRLPEGLQH
jgi:arylsulfatase